MQLRLVYSSTVDNVVLVTDVTYMRGRDQQKWLLLSIRALKRRVTMARISSLVILMCELCGGVLCIERRHVGVLVSLIVTVLIGSGCDETASSKGRVRETRDHLV